MALYTGEKQLNVNDLKRLRDQYNNMTEFSDCSFMNELFHGLDSIIENIELLTRDCDRLRRELDDVRGVIR